MPNQQPNKMWSGRFREPLNRTFLFCSMCSLLTLQECKAKPEETHTEVRDGDYKIVVRTQEFHHSGSLNADVCVAHASDTEFPEKQTQCFLNGYDFSDLTTAWKSPTEVVISFKCGRIATFRNSADVYDNGPAPQEFYAFLNDSCTPHHRFGDVKQ